MSRTVFPILYAQDLAAMVRFYRDPLGMRETYRFPPDGEPTFLALRWGDGQLGLGTYDPMPGLEGRPLLRRWRAADASGASTSTMRMPWSAVAA